MKLIKVSDLDKIQRDVRKKIDNLFYKLIKQVGSMVYGGLEERRTTIYDGCLDVENNLGFLDDIDFAAMLLELEYR